mgnify:CR=1 FL=1
MSGPLTGRGWRLAIDRGGTFTDIVATDPAGAVYAHKVLSRDPAHPGDAAVRGIEELLARHAQSRLKGEDVSPIMRDIMRFNQRNPSVRIKAENLRQAYDRRRDNRRKLTETGILADKQNQRYLGNAAWTRSGC